MNSGPLPRPRVLRALMARCGLVLAWWPLAASADDWPQWRGPERDGVWREQGIVEVFPADGLKVRWRKPIGPGWATPTVADGRVFVTDSDLAQRPARERVHCFDAASGRELWAHATDVQYPEWAFDPQHGGCPTATPLAAEGRLFVVGGNGEVVCFVADTGAVVWRKDLAKQYEIPTLGCRASPLLDGERLVVYVGGKPGANVIALNKDTGDEIWKALDETPSSSSPMIVMAGGRRQLIVWTCSSVTSLDPATGRTWWREPLTTSSNDAIATPVFVAGRLLICGLMFQLEAEKPVSRILWPESKVPSKRLLSNTSTPLLTGDHVFSATNLGDLVCLDAATGQEVWRVGTITDHKQGAAIHLTPNGAAVFLYTDRGDLIRAHLSASGYEEISRQHVIDPVLEFGGRKLTWSAPAYANRHLFARNEREVVCVSLAADKH